MIGSSRIAAAARRALACRARLAARHTPELVTEVTEGAYVRIDIDRLRQFLSIEGINTTHLACLGLGSGVSEFDLDAFAHGLVDLPRAELRILAQVAWEREQFDD